jgi:Flp pilus assembly protein TadG
MPGHVSLFSGPPAYRSKVLNRKEQVVSRPATAGLEGDVLGVRRRSPETTDMSDQRTLRRRGLRAVDKSRGQALVEFAMVLPMLAILIFGIIDFGVAIHSYIALTNATREGARFAAVGNEAGSYPSNCTGSNSTTTIGRVCTAANGLDLADVSSVTVSYPDGQAPGKSVVVSANYTYHFITPLGALTSFFSGGSFPSTISLSASTDMRLE